jgi:hypothetical protein
LTCLLKTVLFKKSVCKEQKNNVFTCLGNPNRIWAISAIHADIDQLTQLHDMIFSHIEPGDRIVYTGNYTGYGPHARETIDEILTFRRLILSLPGMIASDLVYLRGQQEEILQKLLQLQFAPNPTDVYLWMLGNGLSSTLASYGLSHHDGIDACRYGVMGLTKWTAQIRQQIRNNPGHEVLYTCLTRAAHTQEQSEFPMLFVHTGLNVKKSLLEQGDHLWWSQSDFSAISEPYKPFQKVIRGFDPAHKGIQLNCVTATIDGGCGFGGNLVGTLFANHGEILDLVEIA